MRCCRAACSAATLRSRSCIARHVYHWRKQRLSTRVRWRLHAMMNAVLVCRSVASCSLAVRSMRTSCTWPTHPDQHRRSSRQPNWRSAQARRRSDEKRSRRHAAKTPAHRERTRWRLTSSSSAAAVDFAIAETAHGERGEAGGAASCADERGSSAQASMGGRARCIAAGRSAVCSALLACSVAR